MPDNAPTLAHWSEVYGTHPHGIVRVPLVCAIAEFATTNPGCWDPRLIRDQCYIATSDFLDHLERAGITGEVVSGLRMGLVGGQEVVLGGHFAALVDGLTIDWTYRQFDVATPVPRIMPLADWQDEWPETTVRPR